MTYHINGSPSFSKTRYYSGTYEKDVPSVGSQTERDYIYGPEGHIVAYMEKVGSAGWNVKQVYTDHLGSIVSVRSSNGATELGRYGYDAWGNRSLLSGSFTTDRGYCGQEHLDAFGVINMNARLYDPAVGRFLSPDAYVQAPENTQSFNRYSYCLNNPLKYTDNDGESWKSFIERVNNWFDKHIGNWLFDHGVTTVSVGYSSAGGFMGVGVGINNHQEIVAGYGTQSGHFGFGTSYSSPYSIGYNYNAPEEGAERAYNKASGQGGVDVMDNANYIVSNSGTLVGGAQYGVNSMSNSQQWKYSYKASKYLKGKGINVQSRVIKHGANGVLKNASRKITYVGGILAVSDVVIDGELRASHLLNAGMVGVSAIPVAGWIIGGVYFVADMITLGVSRQSIGQHLDNAVGNPLFDDIYNW
jgi:RHS repeat-associated protein